MHKHCVAFRYKACCVVLGGRCVNVGTRAARALRPENLVVCRICDMARHDTRSSHVQGTMLKRRWHKRIAMVAALLVITGIAGVPLLAPAVAAYVCPSCYGLVRVTGTLFVDPAMSAEDTTKLQEVIERASLQVALFLVRLIKCLSFSCA
jgi:hypothetical protein